MPQVQSVMIPIGTKIIDFNLPNAQGNIFSLKNLASKNGILIIFMCNHCPFVKHYFDNFAELEKLCHDNQIALVGINSNDYISYPADSPEKMIEEQEKIGFNFTYLVDKTQEVAKAYKAMCTPDSYLFDGNLELFYRGQLDKSRPSLDITPDLKDIKNAIAKLASNAPIEEAQIPSVGCSIKWIKGNEPEYFSV